MRLLFSGTLHCVTLGQEADTRWDLPCFVKPTTLRTTLIHVHDPKSDPSSGSPQSCFQYDPTLPERIQAIKYNFPLVLVQSSSKKIENLQSDLINWTLAVNKHGRERGRELKRRKMR